MKKEEQIRMLLHPEQYTDEQLDQMLDEVEVPVPDAGEAWRAFRNEGKETAGNRGSFYPVRKIAAMFIGVLMLSGIAYAAYHVAYSTTRKSSAPSQQTEIRSQRRQTAAQAVAAEEPQTAPVVYEDAELATILGDVAAYYQVEVVYRQEASRHIRLYYTWDKQATVDDVIDTFNKFERIHITRDNKKLIVE